MSWTDYVSNWIINYTDETAGKLYENACETGGIVAHADGVVWAAHPGFTFTNYKVDIEKDDGSGTVKTDIDEFANLKGAFENNGVVTGKGGLRINKEKFFLVSYDSDKKVMYLKKNGGGAAVAKTGLAFVIGIFSSSKKTKVHQAEKATTELTQSPGITNIAVDKLQDFLVQNNL